MRYPGAKISEKTLLFDKSARLGETRFETWRTHFRSTKGCVKIGSAPNRNSCGTTRKGKVRTHTHDKVKWRQSSGGLNMTFTKIVLVLVCVMSTTLVA